MESVRDELEKVLDRITRQANFGSESIYLADRAYASGLAYGLAQMTSRTKKDVLAEYNFSEDVRPLPKKRTLTRKKPKPQPKRKLKRR